MPRRALRPAARPTPAGGVSLAPLSQALEAPDQELPPACRLNGALYLGALASLRQERSFFAPPVCWYEMDEEESIDVNTAADLQYARRLAARDKARDKAQDKRRSPAA